ncbi:hypothetical protein OG416_38940 [Streptomyces longwoodensis]|uniref:hypothetical protein n=1 Tax=Streptomyces longwoodensis TaxID=68231 RepID=UPI0030DFC5DF|nr:hypothetical protein OG416_38940 [Streptomyces longwoodensis]
MADFRTVVSLICESTDDDSARRIIAALVEWTGSTTPAVPAPREDSLRPALHEARQLLRAELCERAEAGETLVQPKDFTAWAEEHGLSRPWLQGEFKRLTESGFLQRDAHGSYTIRHCHRRPA